MTREALIEAINELPESSMIFLENFVRFLMAENVQQKLDNTSTCTKKYRNAGGFEGCIQMADDFDAPLDDMKEYM